MPTPSRPTPAKSGVAPSQQGLDRQLIIDYMVMKMRHGDWHGVADAAMDLRELEATYPELATQWNAPIIRAAT